jgi:hypothetical protein
LKIPTHDSKGGADQLEKWAAESGFLTCREVSDLPIVKLLQISKPKHSSDQTDDGAGQLPNTMQKKIQRAVPWVVVVIVIITTGGLINRIFLLC